MSRGVSTCIAVAVVGYHAIPLSSGSKQPNTEEPFFLWTHRQRHRSVIKRRVGFLALGAIEKEELVVKTC